MPRAAALTETDGSRDGRDLEPMTVRDFDRRRELVRRNVHVGLERGRTFRDPVLDGSPGVLGVCELAHLQSERAFAFQIWSSDVNLGTSHFPWSMASLSSRSVYVSMLPVVRMEVTPPARLQAREACRVFRIKRKRSSGRRIVHVIVHADEAGG